MPGLYLAVHLPAAINAFPAIDAPLQCAHGQGYQYNNKYNR